MKGKKHNSRLFRSLSMILAVLMVVSSVNVSMLNVSAEEIIDSEVIVSTPVEGTSIEEANQEVVQNTTETTLADENVAAEADAKTVEETEKNLLAETEEIVTADQEEATTEDVTEEETTAESEEIISEKSLEAVSDKVIDFKDVVTNYPNKDIYITENGYCIGTYDETTNPYIPYNNLTLTGTVDMANNSIIVKSMPAGSVLTLDNLQINSSLKDIFMIYDDVTINYSGTVRLNAYVVFGYNGTAFTGNAHRPINAYGSSVVTITGSGDMYYESLISSAYPYFTLFGNSSVKTTEYTGNIYLDCHKSGNQLISCEYSNEILLETAGTIAMIGGIGNTLFTCNSTDSKLTLSGEEVTISKENGAGIIDKGELRITSKGDVNVINSSASAFLGNGSSACRVYITAANDVKFIYGENTSIAKIIYSNNGSLDVKAGGNVIVQAPENFFGRSTSGNTKVCSNNCLFEARSLNIEAGKDFICKINGGIFNGQKANVDVKGKIVFEGYALNEGSNIKGVMCGFGSNTAINVQAEKSIEIKGDYTLLLTGSGEGTITAGEDFTYEGSVYGNLISFTSSKIQAGGKVDITNTSKVTTPLLAGNSISFDAAKDISIKTAGGNFVSAAFINFNSGASVKLESTVSVENSQSAFFNCGNLMIDAKDNISVKAPATSFLISAGKIDLSASGDISLENNATTNGGISQGNLNVTKANKLDIKAPVGSQPILSNAVFDIPGDITINGTSAASNSTVPTLKIKNAKDVTINLKTTDLESVAINECNIKGDFDLTNSGGKAVKFADNLVMVAKSVDITGNTTSTLISGKNITIKAESVELKNNANGFVISDVLRTESEATLLGFKDSENQETGTGFLGEETKKAAFVKLSSEEVVAFARRKSGSNQVATLDDIEVVILFDGKELSSDLYKLELVGSEAPYEKVDVIAKDTVDSEDGVYLLGQIELDIAANSTNVASVSVGNDTKNFISLWAALDYADKVSTANEPAYVKILTFALIDKVPYTIKGNIILDLNGIIIGGENAAGPVLEVAQKAKLVINNGSIDGSVGGIVNTVDNCAIKANGTLTINGGCYSSKSGCAIVVTSTAKVNINGGEIIGLIIEKNRDQMNDIAITGGFFRAKTKSTCSISCNAPLSYLFRSEYGPVVKDSSDNWISYIEESNTNVSFDVVAGRTDINTISDKFGYLSKIYFDSTTQTMVKGYHTGIDGNLVADTDYTIETPLDYELLDNGFKKKKYVVRGIGKYYGEIVFDYYVVPVPTIVPESSYYVSNSISSTNDIELPEGFKWKEEVSLDEVGTTPNTAYTVYYLDVYSYEDEFDEHEVNIYRSECAHISSEIIYEDSEHVIPYAPPTCTTAGYGYYECLKCKEFLGTVNIPAFGHKAKYIVDWKTLGANSAEVLVNAYCENCEAPLLTNITVKSGESYGSTISLTSNKKSDGGVEWTLKYQGYTESRTVYASGYVVTLDSSSYEYTGVPVKPQPTVYYGDTELVAGKDYTVTYANNTKANRSPIGEVILQGYDKKTKTPTELVPTITIKGKGNYTGSATMSFDIIQRSIKEADVTLLGQGETFTEFQAPASGKSLTLFKVVSYAGKKLANTEYEAKVYASSDYIAYGADAPEVSLKDIPNGEYALVVSGKANYSGNQVIIFNVSNVKYYLANAKVTLDKNNKVKAIKVGAKTFTLDNFIIKYPSDTYGATVGEHQITITPDITKLGSEFAPDSLTVKYTVAPTPIKANWFTMDKSAFTYNGSAQEKPVNKTAAAPAVFEEGVDYKVVQSNINAGNATVDVIGINNYTGKISFKYKINPTAITDAYSVTCDSTVPYSRAGATAKNLVVKDPNSKVLTEGVDYKVSYKNNTKLGTATVVITGIGNYTKSTTGSFTVVGTSIDADNIEISASDMIFKKDGAYKGAITVTDNGKKLGKNDFAVTYEEKASNVQGEDLISRGYIILEATVTGLGNYASTDINNKPIEVKVYYRVAAESINSLRVTVDSNNAVYAEGSEVKPLVTVEYGVRVGLKTIYYKVDSSQYTVSYSNNKFVGTGKVTVTGTKKYLGSKSVTYKIKQHLISF